MKKSDIEKMHAARAELARMLRPGDTVYTRLEHVSRSGMTRRISVMVMRENEPQNITYTVAHALGDGPSFDRSRHDGLRVNGCGMDMGFHLVYSLGRVLFPDGFPVTGVGRNGDTPGHDRDGGYALRHRWI